MLTEEQLIKGLKNIPPLPTAIAEILEVLNQESTDFGLLESKILKDPSLYMRILAIANSPFYGLPREISNIKEACIVLGVASLKQITLAAGVMNNFPPNSGKQINNLDIWRHAMATATAAKVIATRVGADIETTFTAGLMHDVGRMVLDYCFPEEYAQVVAYQNNNNCSLYEAEETVLGVTHCTAGEILAKRWHLPDAITTVIREHHAPAKDSDDIILELVRAGNIICLNLEIDENDDSQVSAAAESTIRRLGMDIPALMACLPEIKELILSSELLLR